MKHFRPTRLIAAVMASLCLAVLLILTSCGSSQMPPSTAPDTTSPTPQTSPEHSHAMQPSPSPEAVATPRIPAHHMSLDEARPLAPTLDPAQFSTPYVLRAYRVARRIPEVLALQPCYCYCDGSGHTSLLDCYATDHGANCHVCIKEALLADKMQREGHSAEDIRNAIIRGEWNEVSLN